MRWNETRQDKTRRDQKLMTCSTGQCNDAQKSAQVKDFTSGVASVNIGESKEFPDFDLICDA